MKKKLLDRDGELPLVELHIMLRVCLQLMSASVSTMELVLGIVYM
uniref:Uncharacterized protein n=1 Tax=Nelumbo nucifera TaxID=4432 RepID=A0A822Z9Q5_NELNU|nr:TPA_asm: hypothetical protein HUJ06_014442 [Nelumbo nucifera]